LKPLACLCLAILAAPAAAGAQSAPNVNILEGQIIHWIGPQTAALQTNANDLNGVGHGKPIRMPFPRMKAGHCHMSDAVLVIRKDGAGEFDATTYTDVASSGEVWRTRITLYDEHGQALFETGDFDGPVMDSAKPARRYVWVNRFSMDPAAIDKVYGRIDHAHIDYSC
jgi:hypothetical protein